MPCQDLSLKKFNKNSEDSYLNGSRYACAVVKYLFKVCSFQSTRSLPFFIFKEQILLHRVHVHFFFFNHFLLTPCFIFRGSLMTQRHDEGQSCTHVYSMTVNSRKKLILLLTKETNSSYFRKVILRGLVGKATASRCKYLIEYNSNKLFK